MFCPKCATQNIESASFCRACGANISLVPQALSGQLPSPDDTQFDRREHRFIRRQPTFEHGITRMVTGLGFLVVALCVAEYAPAGRIWWFWMLIPAFSLLGKGIAEFMRARNRQSTQPPQIGPNTPNELPPRQTAELRAPIPSVTEGTTRHLAGESPTRHFDSYQDQKPS